MTDLFMINMSSLVEFVRPYYVNKDIMHDLSHIDRMIHSANKLLEYHPEITDRDLIFYGSYFHGFIYVEEGLIRQYLDRQGLDHEYIEKIIRISWESQKDEVAETIEAKLLHDAHMIEGGKNVSYCKSLCAGTARGQNLEQTVEYFEKYVLGKGECYLPEAQAIFSEMQQFAKEFIRDLRAGLAGTFEGVFEMPQSHAHNQDLSSQISLLTEIVTQNKLIYDVLTRASRLHIDNYYIGAGCITQSVWNYLSGFPLDYGIKDIDFVYYNESDLSEEAENETIRLLNNEFHDLAIKLDVKNQARVHIWYKDHFGYEIQPYKSLEEAINTWPTTSSAIGVRKQGSEWKVYAPFGLNDLFGMVVRANKAQITKEIYEQKTTNWATKWTGLTIIPWDEKQVNI